MRVEAEQQQHHQYEVAPLDVGECAWPFVWLFISGSKVMQCGADGLTRCVGVVEPAPPGTLSRLLYLVG